MREPRVPFRPDLAPGISLGLEDAAGDQIALNLEKPNLDLVEPGGVSWRVVKVNVGMTLEEGIDSLAFMGREIVDDDVDPLTFGLRGEYFAQNHHELSAGVPAVRLRCDHLCLVLSPAGG